MLLLLLPALAAGQYRDLGADDEALGRSSGAWHQSSSALFANPAGLAYILQTEGTITNDRVFHTTFIGGSYFQPNVGTLAVGGFHGAVDGGGDDVLSIGYAHEFFPSVAAGISIGGMKQDLIITPTFGAGLIYRPAYGSLLRDLTAGAYVQNLTANHARNTPYGSLGLAYWLLNEKVRVQGSYTVGSGLGTVQTGAEAHLLDWLFVRAGTDGWKSFTGGFGIALPTIRIDVAARKSMFLLTFTPRLGTPWYEKRDRHFEAGVNFYKNQKYTEAISEFDWALRYDRNYSPAREYSSAAESAYRMKVEEYYERGKLCLLKKQYRDAIGMFEAALTINPESDSSRAELVATRVLLSSLVDSAVVTAERYMDQRQFRQARAMFQRALDYDSTNDEIRTSILRIDSTRSVLIDSLTRTGDSALKQSLYETARRAYEQALTLDPGNPALVRRLGSLNEKVTIRDLINEGRRQLALGEPQNALRAFRTAIEKDPSNDEARKKIDLCLSMLKDVIDGLFHEGLRAYANEEYETAIDLFSQVMAIDPNRHAAREYLDRANEKLKALEQLH